MKIVIKNVDVPLGAVIRGFYISCIDRYGLYAMEYHHVDSDEAEIIVEDGDFQKGEKSC